MPYNSQIDERKERMKRSCVEDIYSIRKIYMRKVFQKWWWKMKLSLKAQTMRKQNCIPFNDCNINNFNSLHTHTSHIMILYFHWSFVLFKPFLLLIHQPSLASFRKSFFFHFKCFYCKSWMLLLKKWGKNAIFITMRYCRMVWR